MKRILTLAAAMLLSGVTPSFAIECFDYAWVYRDAAGNITRISHSCDNCREGAKKCHRERIRNRHGEVRTYCVCEKGDPEPTDCHIVITNPDGGGGLPPQIACAGGCATGAICPPPQPVGQPIPLPGGRTAQKVECRCVPN